MFYYIHEGTNLNVSIYHRDFMLSLLRKITSLGPKFINMTWIWRVVICVTVRAAISNRLGRLSLKNHPKLTFLSFGTKRASWSAFVKVFYIVQVSISDQKSEIYNRHAGESLATGGEPSDAHSGLSIYTPCPSCLLGGPRVDALNTVSPAISRLVIAGNACGAVEVDSVCILNTAELYSEHNDLLSLVMELLTHCVFLYCLAQYRRRQEDESIKTCQQLWLACTKRGTDG